MLTSYEATGKTLDEAIRAGLNAMGVERDAVSVEVLEKPKSGFFGLGGTLAKVKLSLVHVEEKPVKAAQTHATPAAPVSHATQTARPAAPVSHSTQTARPAAPVSHAAQTARPAAPVSHATQTARPAAPVSQAAQTARPAAPVSQAVQTPRPAATTAAPQAPTSHKSGGSFTPFIKQNASEPSAARPARTAPPPRSHPRPVTHPATQEQCDAANVFVKGLMAHMHTEVTVETSIDEEGILFIALSGENMGNLIGRRGDTLDAVQHLVSHVINKDADAACRVHVDAADYRKKRQESLQRLAERMAANAIKYRTNMTLEPMNAFERHIIHVALQGMPGIATFSTGVEPQRRVVIAPQREGAPSGRPPRAGGRPVSDAPRRRDVDDQGYRPDDRGPKMVESEDRAPGTRNVTKPTSQAFIAPRPGASSRPPRSFDRPQNRERSFDRPRSDRPDRPYTPRPATPVTSAPSTPVAYAAKVAPVTAPAASAAPVASATPSRSLPVKEFGVKRTKEE